MIASFESCSTATSSRALCVTQHRDVCEGDDGAFDLLRVGAIGQDPRQEGLARRRVNLGGKAAGHPLDPSQVARKGRVVHATGDVAEQAPFGAGLQVEHLAGRGCERRMRRSASSRMVAIRGLTRRLAMSSLLSASSVTFSSS